MLDTPMLGTDAPPLNPGPPTDGASQMLQSFLSPDQLAALMGELRQQVLTDLQPQIRDIHKLAEQAAINNDPSMRGLLDQQPKSHPEGWLPGMPNAKERQATAKLKVIAERRGGSFNANPAYRHYTPCPHDAPETCTECWTPEEEARWMFATGLTRERGPALYPVEAPGSQRPNAPTHLADQARVGRHNRRTQ